MIGIVRASIPRPGFHYDESKRYIDAVKFLDAAAREKILERDVRRVYPRLDALLNHPRSAS